MKNQNIFAGLRDLLILWSSQAISSLGTAMTNFALIIWVYEQKGTASSITTLTICSYLPTILFRFIAGAIADRWDKKRIMLEFVQYPGKEILILIDEKNLSYQLTIMLISLMLYGIKGIKRTIWRFYENRN